MKTILITLAVVIYVAFMCLSSFLGSKIEGMYYNCGKYNAYLPYPLICIFWPISLPFYLIPEYITLKIEERIRRKQEWIDEYNRMIDPNMTLKEFLALSEEGKQQYVDAYETHIHSYEP